MKVWIVTEGEYSDYRVAAVFSSRELAQQYYERYKPPKSDVNEPDEWEVDAPETMKPHICVAMHRDGTVNWVELRDGPAGLNYCIHDILSWIVETDNEERAIKVTNEKRIQILAADAWGNKARLKQLGLAPEPPVTGAQPEGPGPGDGQGEQH